MFGKALKSTSKFAPVRNLSSLKERIAAQIPAKRDQLKQINKELGNVVIDSVTAGQVTGGMRGIKSMLWDTSLLDVNEGIRFRGKTIPELQAALPGVVRPGKKFKGEPLPEATLWYLLTGEVPTAEQVKELTAELHKRSELPAHVVQLIKSLPKDTHPMTQFSAALLACQNESQFAKKYHTTNKADLWQYAYEDSLDVIAKAPRIAAQIFRHSFGDDTVPEIDTSLDIAANFNRMIGFPKQGKPIKPAYSDAVESDDAFDEFMRLYFTLHSDHEGGNVSAHTVHLVGSALSDPYLSMSAGLNGLAGPLHGLANQEVLDWTLKAQQAIIKDGKGLNQDSVAKLAWDTLNSGKVIPGFGHAVLRVTDPRYTCQREFSLRHIPNDELFKLVSLIYNVVPPILTQLGKVKNPWPNVDAHSGCVLYHYGLTQTNFYTVLFGVSRAIGTLSQLVWDRALGLPIERPKSLTTELLVKLINENKK